MKQLYNETRFKKIFKDTQKKLRMDYDINSIFELLIYSKILFPSSKNETYNNYNLFPGNQSEKITLRPTLKKTKSNFGIHRTIVVADRGLNTSDNIFFHS